MLKLHQHTVNSCKAEGCSESSWNANAIITEIDSNIANKPPDRSLTAKSSDKNLCISISLMIWSRKSPVPLKFF